MGFEGSADTHSMADPSSISRICLWGGPGIGKSTHAANVFASLKIAGCSVELVNEYIKAWAYEKRQLSGFDQVYIFAKQQRLEERVLRAGVQMIVTDSPLLMQCVYAKKYQFVGWRELLSIGKMFNELHPSLNYLLRRKNGTYQEEGRWQNEDQARQLDDEIEDFLIDNRIPYVPIENDATKIADHVKMTLKEDPRKTGLKNGFRQLTVPQLLRVVNFKGEMVLDTFNYENGQFCPLAVGVGLHEKMKDATHEKVLEELNQMGYKVNNTRGIAGEFYTKERKRDLFVAAQEVLEEKLGGIDNE